MERPKIAIVSFPGNNCEVESIRAVKNAGMDPVFFKWNDSKEKLIGIDGYLIPGGFSYEDRGRAGMVAARDPIMEFIGKEASQGKAVMGICNGAQVLVESGLIPLGRGLDMCLAKNTVGGEAAGFLNLWVWIKPTCGKDRCVASGWEGTLALPIAHGEGRFTTRDRDVLSELKKNDQMAFSYCDKNGSVSEEASVCPNGSMLGAAGICNPEGNVLALMPHPERSNEGGRFFESMRRWIMERNQPSSAKGGLHRAEMNQRIQRSHGSSGVFALQRKGQCAAEIFIDTIIVNNEERTVEQASRRIVPKLKLKQLKYFASGDKKPFEVLSHLSLFNPNKEIAYVRRGSEVRRWNAARKEEEPGSSSPLDGDQVLLRRDQPDTGAGLLGEGGGSGVCYVLSNVSEEDMKKSELLEVFCNPHASVLERIL